MAFWAVRSDHSNWNIQSDLKITGTLFISGQVTDAEIFERPLKDHWWFLGQFTTFKTLNSYPRCPQYEFFSSPTYLSIRLRANTHSESSSISSSSFSGKGGRAKRSSSAGRLELIASSLPSNWFTALCFNKLSNSFSRSFSEESLAFSFWRRLASCKNNRIQTTENHNKTEAIFKQILNIITGKLRRNFGTM